MKSIVLFLFILSQGLNTLGQNNICKEIDNEFQQAINNKNFSEAEYLYNKKLNICSPTAFDMGLLSGLMDQKGFTYKWMEDKSFVIESFTDPNIDFNQYKPILQFENLPQNHALKQKYSTELDLLNALHIPEDEVRDGSNFIPNKNLLIVKLWGANQFYRIDDLRPYFTNYEASESMEYMGNDLFVSNTTDSAIVYRLNDYQLKKIIQAPGNAYIYASKTNESIIIIENYAAANNFIQIYDQNGIQKEKNITNLQVLPLSRHILINRDEKKQLYNYDLKQIIDDSEYIDPFWKNDQCYILVQNKDYSYHLLDVQGKIIHSKYDYEQMYHQSNGYALVTKNDHNGLIDLLSNTITIPLQKNDIKYFAKGMYGVKNNENWNIVDEKNRLLQSIKCEDLSLLYESYIPYFIFEESNGNKGLIHFSGAVKLQPVYSEIKFNPLNQQIDVVSKVGQKTSIPLHEL